MSSKYYNKILLTVFTILGVCISALMFWLQPFLGDLSRIGGFTENDYGWNGQQKKFTKPHYKIGDSIDDYDQYYDIVTIGDSFSVNQEQSWQNYLALSTNSTIITFHRQTVTASSLLNHSQFKETPPKLFIFEIVEHGIQTALHDITLSHQESNGTLDVTNEFNVEEVNFDSYMQSYTRVTENKFSMDTALHYLKINIRQLLGSRKKVIPYQLKNKRKFFSNRAIDTVLFYHLDNLKLSITNKEWEIIEKRFAALQHLSELNQKTKFLSMVAPDKRTAYSGLINDGEKYPSVLDLMPNINRVNWIDVLGGINKMIDNEEVDIYLPNDFHWGYKGYYSAYKSTLDALTGISNQQ